MRGGGGGGGGGGGDSIPPPRLLLLPDSNGQQSLKRLRAALFPSMHVRLARKQRRDGCRKSRAIWG